MTKRKSAESWPEVWLRQAPYTGRNPAVRLYRWARLLVEDARYRLTGREP